MAGTEPKISVVVLTSIPLGVEVTAALRRLPEVGQLALFTAPSAPGKSVARLVRDAYRYEGMPGLIEAARRRARKALGLQESQPIASQVSRLCPSVAHFAVARFHSESCRAQLDAMAPDLGVVVGTHVLRADLYSIPRLGCINLHLGYAPDFRGSSPGFYEMLAGVPESGVTVHRVTDTLDGGNVILRERFALDPAPPGDPMAYLKRYLADVLSPNGVRIMTAAVAGIARGTATETPQDASQGLVSRRSTYALKRELRRRVATRRAGAPAAVGRTLTLPATGP